MIRFSGGKLERIGWTMAVATGTGRRGGGKAEFWLSIQGEC